MKTVSGAIRLTERDECLLTDLYQHGTMLRGQLQALHFEESGLRRVNRRLQSLSQARLIVGAPLPLGPLSTLTPASSPGSSGQWVYRLGSQAVPILAARLGLDRDIVRRRVRLGSPTALAHALEIAQARVVLAVLGKTEPHFRLESFQPEVCHSWRARLADGQERGESFRPDALIRYRWEGCANLAFLEIDLGHTSQEEWKHKRELAGRFLTSGLFAKHYTDRFVFDIWTLTTTTRRADTLRRAAEKDAPGLYHVTTLQEFSINPLSLINLPVPGFVGDDM